MLDTPALNTQLCAPVVGLRHVILRTVSLFDLATYLYPDIDKAPVLATARLLEWIERAVMERISGMALGSRISLAHTDCAVLGSAVTVEVGCYWVLGRTSEWEVEVSDSFGSLAFGSVTFVQSDRQHYYERRVARKLAALARS